MNSSEAIVAAALTCSPALRKQIGLMFQRDALSVEQISQALSLPLALVEKNLPSQVMSTGISSGLQKATNTVQPTNPLRSLLHEYTDRAAEVMGELLDHPDNDVLRFKAAEFVLETAAGLKDAKSTESTFQVDEMNIIIQQATEAYKRNTIDI